MVITFTLSIKDKPLIKSGQEVDFTTPLLKKGSTEEVVIPVAQALKIPPDKIFLYLKKFVGEDVKQGELLAEKKGFLDKKEYLSEYDGVIKEIDHEKGDLIVTTQKESTQIVTSYFKGKIDEVKKQEVKLVVKDEKHFVGKEITTDFGGETLVVDEATLANVNPDDVRGKVILTTGLKPYNQSKLEVMGVAGFISNQSISDQTPPPFAKVKDVADWEQIKKLKLPYCLVDKKSGTIYFYQAS